MFSGPEKSKRKKQRPYTAQQSAAAAGWGALNNPYVSEDKLKEVIQACEEVGGQNNLVARLKGKLAKLQDAQRQAAEAQAHVRRLLAEGMQAGSPAWYKRSSSEYVPVIIWRIEAGSNQIMVKNVNSPKSVYGVFAPNVIWRRG